ncbi:hypothetical protein RUND412_004154 [Rhizina undulata]
MQRYHCDGKPKRVRPRSYKYSGRYALARSQADPTPSQEASTPSKAVSTTSQATPTPSQVSAPAPAHLKPLPEETPITSFPAPPTLPIIEKEAKDPSQRTKSSKILRPIWTNVRAWAQPLTVEDRKSLVEGTNEAKTSQRA